LVLGGYIVLVLSGAVVALLAALAYELVEWIRFPSRFPDFLRSPVRAQGPRWVRLNCGIALFVVVSGIIVIASAAASS
jgi:hypothetical protein